MSRSILKVYGSRFAPIADLVTYSPLPSAELQQLDPFLFLNHHGYQEYKPNNNGLPFGPHPHRGMETVTFILSGDIKHEDSGGHESVIDAGGIQYMRAGRGLLHAETSSDRFKKEGGPLEILQLWLNMPAKQKMAEPLYKGLQANEIPVAKLNEGRVKYHLIFGNLKGVRAPLTHDALDLTLGWLTFSEGGIAELPVPADHTIFCYTVGGSFQVQGEKVGQRKLIEFNYEEGSVEINALEEGVILFGHAKPLNEPVVAQGPFVMNSEEEIRQAYIDYQQGKFGTW